MMELLQAKPTARCNTIHHQKGYMVPEKAIRSVVSSQALVLGSLPDGQAESDLVDEICKVVDEVQAAVIDTAHEVTKKVAGWVNRPTCSDNETHGAERGLGELVD